MGWTQIPDIITQPHDKEGKKDKDYLENARKYDPTAKGILGTVLVGIAVVAFLYLLSVGYWYLAVVVVGLLVVFLAWPIIANRTPLSLGGRPSK